MSQGPPTSGSGAEPGGQPAEPVQPEVPAGWYPHPTAPGWEAYWTGAAWGPETRPAQAAPAPPDPQPAEQQAQTEAQPTAGVAAAPVVATPAAAAAGATAPEARSSSSLPVILCVLGAIVAIVGSFLPMASSSIDGIDFTDNTLVGQSIGIAVIAVAVIGAGLAVWSYLNANRTWLVVLLGAVIVGIAAYMGLVGVDDLTPDLAVPTSFGKVDPEVASQLSEAASQATDPGASASTGIFAVAIGGLLMVLGGVGLARENR